VSYVVHGPLARAAVVAAPGAADAAPPVAFTARALEAPSSPRP
jgi:hypothetical protein